MENNNIKVLNTVQYTAQELSYEEAFEKLKIIVNKMQQDNITLDETLNLYKEGKMLSERCNQLLNEAKLEIEDLMKDNKEPTY